MNGIWIALFAVLCGDGSLSTGAAPQIGRRVQDRIDESMRREGDALARIADEALAGRAGSADLVLEWRNDFFKARPGTFVPFSVSFTAPTLSSRRALLYIRVETRAPGRARLSRPFAYETIFPVQLEAAPGETVSVTRGFAIPAGRYRVVVALRESPEDRPGEAETSRKAGVLVRDLDVPDFWTDDLATSTVMLASRVQSLSGPVPADELDEDPYAVGSNRILVTRERSFGREQELIVAFLIYNLSMGPDKHFDAQVDYHLYRKNQGGQAAPGPALDHPPARAGERYVTRTNPQRFNPSMMGAQFDPAAGTPVLAGQGILLAGFDPGDYRLGITVTDLLSRQTVTRDVVFKVTGS